MIPWNPIYETLAAFAFILYLLLFLISLILKNIFWFKYLKNNSIHFFSKWIFFIIPIASIFLPKVILFFEIRQIRKKHLPIYLLMLILNILPIILLAGKAFGISYFGYLFDKFKPSSGIIVFMFLILLHLIYAHLMNSIQLSVTDKLKSEIDDIGNP